MLINSLWQGSRHGVPILFASLNFPGVNFPLDKWCLMGLAVLVVMKATVRSHCLGLLKAGWRAELWSPGDTMRRVHGAFVAWCICCIIHEAPFLCLAHHGGILGCLQPLLTSYPKYHCLDLVKFKIVATRIARQWGLHDRDDAPDLGCNPACT